MTETTAPTLVLGGTGKTGRRLVARLRTAGHPVRAAARGGEVYFDWQDETTHDEALEGAQAVYIVPPALRLDYGPTIRRFVGRARAAGVERLVLLGARGGQLAPGGPQAEAEATVRDSGLAWTLLRGTWFLQNFTEAFLRPGEDGAIVAPTGEGAEPFVDVDDIAAVAAAALTEEGHAGKVYDLSGPAARTFGEVAAVLWEVTGREVRHVDLPVAEWQAGAASNGIPEDYAALLAMLLTAIGEGRDAFLSDGVQRSLGREPASLEDWAAREANGRLTAQPSKKA